jgi:SAM-dependent methyltransferase
MTARDPLAMAERGGDRYRDPPPGEASLEILGLAVDAEGERSVLDWSEHGGLTRALAATGAKVVRVGGRAGAGGSPIASVVETVSVADGDPVPFADGSFDLVALEADPRATGESISVAQIESKLDEARRLLRPGGQILITTRSRLRDGVWGWRSPGLRRLARMLKQRGFGSVRDFGVQPRDGSPILVAALASREGLRALYSRSGSGALASRLLALLGASPLGRRAVARRFIVAGREPPRSAVERAVAAEMGSASQLDWIVWSNPGQSIARVSVEEADYIVRLALDPAGASRIARNAAALDRVRAGVDEAHRRLVPELVWSGSFFGRAATLETVLPGRPLDTLGGRGVARESAAERLGFLASLERIEPWAPARNREWMERWLDEVRAKLADTLEPQRLSGLCDYLASSPDVERMRIGSVHGDFSPRNLLSEKRSGRLTGVIDWDLSSAAAPTFVDPLHWEVRCGAWKVGRYLAVLLRRLERIRAGQAIERATQVPVVWWHNSLWAHLVYGIWYNLNLADLHGESRVRIAARLAEFAPHESASSVGSRRSG